MRNNIPSVKTLETAFPTKGKVLRQLLQSASAVREHPAAIAFERQCYSSPDLYLLRLYAINAEIEGFGIEYIQGNGTRLSPSFDYINTGDTYNTTIIRFTDGRYRVGDWGTIVERGNYA